MLGSIGMLFLWFFILIISLGLIAFYLKLQSNDIKQPSISRVIYMDFTRIHLGIFRSDVAWMSMITKQWQFSGNNAHEFAIKIKDGMGPGKYHMEYIRFDNSSVMPFNGGTLVLNGLAQLNSNMGARQKKIESENIRLHNELARSKVESAKVNMDQQQIWDNAMKAAAGFEAEKVRQIYAGKNG